MPPAGSVGRFPVGCPHVETARRRHPSPAAAPNSVSTQPRISWLNRHRVPVTSHRGARRRRLPCAVTTARTKPDGSVTRATNLLCGQAAACRSARAAASPDTADASPLVAEVLELQGNAEVVLLQRGDDRLQVVALLAGDPDLLSLRLRLDALGGCVLDRLVDLARLVARDAGDDLGLLTSRAARRLFDLAVLE